MSSLPRLKEYSPTKVLEWAGSLVRRLNQDLKAVNQAEIALGAGLTSTTVADQSSALGSQVFLQPKNASAAALTGVFVETVFDGQFTFQHSLSVGGEAFAYVIVEQDGGV